MVLDAAVLVPGVVPVVVDEPPADRYRHDSAEDEEEQGVLEFLHGPASAFGQHSCWFGKAQVRTGGA